MLLNQAGYAPFGPAVGWVYGNGRTLSRSHTRNYQAETIQDNASGGLSLHYGYDAAGQLTELKDGLQSAFLARYDYDNLGRLTILRDGPSSTPIETYTYDATGNRTSLLHGGITTSFTYPGSNHRLSSAGGVARSYDGVGNTTAIGGTAKQFNYGEDDRMNSVSQNGTMLRSYAYNALGERVLSTIPAVAGNPDGSGGTPAVNTYTVYDESGRWLGDYDHNGAVLQQAIWLDDLPVGLLAGTGANQKLHYIEPDHLGTPRAVIDRTRDVAIWTWALQGEAFGNSPPNQDPDLDSTNFVFDMRFPGQRYEAATGLNYNYFRDYDAGSGRYVQSDPIGLDGGANTYGYVSAAPVTGIDPFGLETCVLITRNGLGLADHSALYLSRGGDSDSPVIYDPSGSYARSLDPYNQDQILFDDATIEKFSDFYRKHDGSTTESVCQKTTVEEERRLREKVALWGGQSGARCAYAVSRVLVGSPFFEEVRETRIPGVLFRGASGISDALHVPSPYLADPFK